KNGELIIVADIRAAKVNVELNLNPETIKRMIISGSNGDVTMKKQEVKDLTIDLLNDDVNLEETVTDQAYVRTSRGNITVDRGAYGNVELVSMVETINTDQLNAKDINLSDKGSVNLTIKNKNESNKKNTNKSDLN